jgi:hypothetical protein
LLPIAVIFRPIDSSGSSQPAVLAPSIGKLNGRQQGHAPRIEQTSQSIILENAVRLHRHKIEIVGRALLNSP